MKDKDLIAALKRLKVETGSLACLGCGREHNCSTQGCAILREAVEQLELHMQFLECKIVQPLSPDYPEAAYCIHDNEKYSILKLGDNYFVPLFQVIDVLSGIKPDAVIRDGIRYCGNCGAKMGVVEPGDEHVQRSSE